MNISFLEPRSLEKSFDFTCVLFGMKPARSTFGTDFGFQKWRGRKILIFMIVSRESAILKYNFEKNKN